jgi:hypothetical protein
VTAILTITCWVQKFSHRNFFSFFKIPKILSIVNSFLNTTVFPTNFANYNVTYMTIFREGFLYHPFPIWKHFSCVIEYSYSLQFNQCHKPVVTNFMSCTCTINEVVTATLQATFAPNNHRSLKCEHQVLITFTGIHIT